VPLGADVSGSQFLEPDGAFPNHIPNPENKAAMDAAVKAVTVSGGHGLGAAAAGRQPFASLGLHRGRGS
jgi:phosphomannomutase